MSRDLGRVRRLLRPERVEDPPTAADWPVPAARADGAAPVVAAITMARDEGAMIAKWVAHYSAQLGRDNVFVVDDNSSDGSTDDLACTVIRVPPLQRFSFQRSRMGVVSGIAEGLHYSHDAVIFADADEFIVPDPRLHASIPDFVAARPGRLAIGVQAYNVVHDVAHEPALDLSRPVLEQRRLAKFLPLMCKPSIKWVPAPWAHGSHGVHCPFEIDPELFMFHLKFADRDLLEHAATRRYELSASEGRAGQTSWSRPADEMVTLLDDLAGTLDPDDTKKFRPGPGRLASTVRRDGPLWRSVGEGQVAAMAKRAAVRIPRRFASLV